MTESQYVRANKKVYPVVVVQFVLMMVSMLHGFLDGISINEVALLILAAAGLIYASMVIKTAPETKMCGMKLLGVAAAVYFLYMLFDMAAVAYAFCFPLMAASIIYLNVRFLYYGGTVTIVGCVIHTIILYVTNNSGKNDMIFNLAIIIVMLLIV